MVQEINTYTVPLLIYACGIIPWTYLHTYIHTHTHTYLHTFIHTYIHTYNHRQSECKGEEACPKCAGNHRLKDCVSEPNSFKCVNCITYIKFNPNKNVCTNHSSLDRNCPAYKLFWRGTEGTQGINGGTSPSQLKSIQKKTIQGEKYSNAFN